jgi:AcrR family transcriptional regulator
VRADAQRNRDRIVEVARQEFRERGYDTSLDDIAKKAGVGAGTLYRHFPNRDALLDAVMQSWVDRVTDATVAHDVARREEHPVLRLIPWVARLHVRGQRPQAYVGDAALAEEVDVVDAQRSHRRLDVRGTHEAKTAGLGRGNAVNIAPQDVMPVATAMVVVLTYWLSFEYVRDPRNALEPASAGAALMRGAFHVLSLLSPYLAPDQREHLRTLVGNYTQGD